MTDSQKTYLGRGKRDDLKPRDVENEAWVPAPFAEVGVDPCQDQTMGRLDEALQAATDGGEIIEVDDSYEGESGAPGQPS